MVKPLDDKFPELLEHVGWRLWRAARRWQAAFEAGMVAMGHPWFGEARAAVIANMDRTGTRQAELAGRLGVSKQAIQQFVDDLVADGVVERRPDPDDRRGRIVVFTAAGRKLLADANAVKRRVEADFRWELGESAFKNLTAALKRLDERR